MSIIDKIFDANIPVANGNNNVQGNNNTISNNINLLQMKKYIKTYSIRKFKKINDDDYELSIPYTEHNINFPIIVKIFFKNSKNNLEEILSAHELKNDHTVVVCGAFQNIADEFIVVII